MKNTLLFSFFFLFLGFLFAQPGMVFHADKKSFLGTNLIVNGDFNAGNSGFTSGYVFSNTNTIEGQYWVGSNPQLWNGAMTNCNDHTGNGNMLLLNGHLTSGIPVWCQTVTVAPAVAYTFTFWGMTTSSLLNPAQLEVFINNVSLGASVIMPSSTCNWQQYSFLWNSGSNTSATICIYNKNTQAVGNDFAIDDISFSNASTLGPAYIDSVCGLNYTSASVLIQKRYDPYTIAGNYGTGLPTTLSVSGIPPCAQILKAYIWYSVSYVGANAQPSNIDLTNPAPATFNFPSTILGTDIAKCWGETGTAVYRADVTPAIIGNGNYVLNINGITGTLPPIFNNPYDQIDGATLLIIYKDLSATYKGTIVVWDGIITSVGGNPTQTITGFTSCTASSNASAFMIVSDMQDNSNGNSHPSTLNGVTSNFPNKFWCWNWTTTNVASGQNSSLFGANGLGNDCFTIAMNGLYYQTNCTTCTPSVLSVSVSSTPSACNFNNGSATVTPSGGVPPYTYIWNPGGQTNQTATGLSPGTYTVTITDASGCTITNTISVGFIPPAVINAGNNQTICIGSSVTLNASGGVSYVWTPSSGLSNATIANPIANPTSTITYTVVGTDGNGCTNSASVTITVNPLPSINAGTDVTICLGSSTTLSAQGTGTFSWSPLGSLSCTTCANPIASPSSQTSYTVTLTDANSCTNTDVVTVFIYPFSAVNAGSDVSICFGTSATLNATGTGNFQWSPSFGLSCTSCQNPVANPTSTTTYTVILTDSNSCTNTDSVTVTVNPLPVPAPGPVPGYVCPGFSDTIYASGGIIYSWSPASSLSNPNISNPVATPSVTTVYTVTVTDANGCVNSDTLLVLVAGKVPTFAGHDVSICIGQTSVTLGGNPTSPSGTIYTWSPSAGLSSTTVPNPIASPTITTTYVVTTANDTCSGSDTVTVFVNPLPVVDAGADVTICLNSSTTLNASGGTNYLWTPAAGLSNPNISNPLTSPSVSTHYTCTITDANGCTNFDTVAVNVLPLPVANAGFDVSICYGDSISLNSQGGVIYSWSPSNGLNNPSISNPVSGTTTTTNYTVIVTDTNGCVNYDSVIVFVWNLPVVTASADTGICMGSSVTLSAQGGVSYSWFPSLGLNNSLIASPVASPSATTTYYVVGTDMNGCKNMDSVTVSINPMPVANFGYTIFSECEGVEIKFIDSSINATAWLWNFGNNTSTIQNPTHSFSYQNSFTVTLIAFNPPCSDTVSKIITVSDVSAYILSQKVNVFTPNNDGINDCFRLINGGKYQGCAELTVYDRWGVPVFRSAYSGMCWDGHTSAGELVSEGTYFYILDLNGAQLKGFVTVIR